MVPDSTPRYFYELPSHSENSSKEILPVSHCHACKYLLITIGAAYPTAHGSGIFLPWPVGALPDGRMHGIIDLNFQQTVSSAIQILIDGRPGPMKERRKHHRIVINKRVFRAGLPYGIKFLGLNTQMLRRIQNIGDTRSYERLYTF